MMMMCFCCQIFCFADQLVGPDQSSVSKAKSVLDAALGFVLSTDPLITTVSVDIPKNKHGALIGAQAAVLQQIEKTSGGCGLTFPDRSSTSSIIQIEGSASVIEAAIKQIESIVGAPNVKRLTADEKSAPATTATAAGPAPPISMSGLTVQSQNGVDLVRLQISKRVQHLLIGTKGATAKRLQESCDVRIRIPAYVMSCHICCSSFFGSSCANVCILLFGEKQMQSGGYEYGSNSTGQFGECIPCMRRNRTPPQC